jgi:hypothetical protein
MDYNKFIAAHATRYCIHYNFADYYSAKKAAKVKGSPTEKGTGKIIPSPNQIARAIAAKLTCNTAVRSHLGGKVQQVMIADKEQFLKLAGSGKKDEVRKGDGEPCTFQVGIEVRLKNYIALAKKLGLM